MPNIADAGNLILILILIVILMLGFEQQRRKVTKEEKGFDTKPNVGLATLINTKPMIGIDFLTMDGWPLSGPGGTSDNSPAFPTPGLHGNQASQSRRDG